MQHRRRPVHLAQALILGAACCVANAAQLTAPAEIAQALPRAQAAGEGSLTWWGLPVYDARLWVEPGFAPADFQRHGFALQLTYSRALRGKDIARRSIDEMRRIAQVGDAEALRWLEQLQAIFPDVQRGDRIAGVNRPGRGVTFLVNGRPAGFIEDPRFGAAFFGIWLAPATPLPELRASLLAAVRP